MDRKKASKVSLRLSLLQLCLFFFPLFLVLSASPLSPAARLLQFFPALVKGADLSLLLLLSLSLFPSLSLLPSLGMRGESVGQQGRCTDEASFSLLLPVSLVAQRAFFLLPVFFSLLSLSTTSLFAVWLGILSRMCWSQVRLFPVAFALSTDKSVRQERRGGPMVGDRKSVMMWTRTSKWRDEEERPSSLSVQHRSRGTYIPTYRWVHIECIYNSLQTRTCTPASARTEANDVCPWTRACSDIPARCVSLLRHTSRGCMRRLFLSLCLSC